MSLHGRGLNSRKLEAILEKLFKKRLSKNSIIWKGPQNRGDEGDL